MRKTIYYADFTFRYTYQYYSKRNNVLTKSGKEVGSFSGVVPRIYLEGDEETVWNDIKLKLGDCETKRFTLTHKEIKNIKDTGKQNGVLTHHNPLY